MYIYLNSQYTCIYVHSQLNDSIIIWFHFYQYRHRFKMLSSCQGRLVEGNWCKPSHLTSFPYTTIPGVRGGEHPWKPDVGKVLCWEGGSYGGHLAGPACCAFSSSGHSVLHTHLPNDTAWTGQTQAMNAQAAPCTT
jgi:hypothetical protein